MNFTQLIYTLKIWLTSVFIAQIFDLIYMALSIHMFSNDSYVNATKGVIEFYLFISFLQFVFSIPTMFLFWASIEFISSLYLKHLDKILIISITGIVLTIATFMFFLWTINPFNIDKDILLIMICNCICICAGSWIYNQSINRK